MAPHRIENFLAENEEALLAAGYQRVFQNWQGRGRGRGRGRGGRGRGGVRRNERNDTSEETNQSDGVVNNSDNKRNNSRGITKRINPVGGNGNVLTCVSCGSYRHLLPECPDSWENLEKANICNLAEQEEEDGEITESSVEEFKKEMFEEEEEVNVLFTGEIKVNIARLGMEAQNSMVVDSACSKTVCGKSWLKCYLDSLSDSFRLKVKFDPGTSVYKFGGGVKLRSCASVTIPVFIGGVERVIVTDVVESDIPLLWSTEDMKKAQVVLNFKNDTAEIYGSFVNLQNTTSGHYCVPLMPGEILVEDVLITKSKKNENIPKKLLHLHRQFAHPPMEKLVKLLKDAGFWEDDFTKILENIHEQCVTCKEFAKVPPRPVVSLPMASKFNEKVAMDLKQWNERWILHLIDMFTRLTVSVFVNRKKPSAIIDKIMLHWVGAGFGVMGGILSDNGGEFNADEMREVCSVLNVYVNTTGAESPFQNGLCERVHSVTDMMLKKLKSDHPNISLEVLLCWACNARNSLQMWQGFSSYQLVFGQNPNLPNIMTDNLPALEGTTTSETLAKHINALHSSRQAFIRSESDERVRRALRHKIRASEQSFTNGDRVYYKRQGSEKYLGPGKVVFQDGKVVFVRHGGVFVRVSPTHLIKDTNAALSQGEEKTDSRAAGPEEEVLCRPEKEVSCPETGEGEEESDEEVVPTTNSSQPLESESNLEIPTQDNVIHFPKKGQTIQYQKDNSWKSAVVLGRGGKVGSKWENWCNVIDESGEKEGVNLAVKDNWRLVQNEEEVEEVHVVIVPRSEHNSEDCLKAKRCELDKLKEFNTYTEVEDKGQFRISTTWAMTRKGDGVRARLVARGFEEENTMPKDSPTVARSTLRLFLSICASQNWKLRSTDIRSAFLQGKLLERDVYIKPPKEALVRKGFLWKLRQGLYGLNDAARQFYISVAECLDKVGCKKSRLDPALFTYHVENKLEGLFVCHVDDFSHAGTELFNQIVIKRGIHSRFKVGSSGEGSFEYIGFNLTQNSDGSIVLDQSEYVQEMDSISVSSERKNMNSEELQPSEYTCLRSIVGSMNWAVQGTRPDLVFDMVELSTKSRKGTVADLVRATKCVKKLKYDDSWLLFSSLMKNDPWRIIVFTDASHGNLSEGTGSMGAHVVFLVDQHENCCTLTWHGGKIKRVVRSTIAAEALSLCEGIEDGIFLKHLLTEMLPDRSNTSIDVYVDNRDVVDALYSTKSVDDKRLRIDISSIKEFISNGEVNSVKWCAGSLQLADCMTKKGVRVDNLMEILRRGRLNLKGWS